MKNRKVNNINSKKRNTKEVSLQKEKNNKVNAKKSNINDINLQRRKVLKVTIIAIAVVILLYIIGLLINLIKNPTETFVVENGKIYQEEYAEGYIIRDETLVDIDDAEQGIVAIKSEGEKVGKGESIYRYCTDNEEEINQKIEEIDLEIQNNLSDEETYLSTDVTLINSQIDDLLEQIYESNNLQDITQYKSDINSYLTSKMKIKAENSSNETLVALLNKRNSYEEELSNNSTYITAETSGVISYRVDGLEEVLTADDFSYLSEDFLNNLDVETGEMVASSSTDIGKIVNNFECYITTVLDSDEAKASEVGDTLKLRLQNSDEISAEIVYKATEDNGKVLLVFEVDDSVEELIKYRKTSFDVIWWSDSGLKIPNSAIKYDGDIAYVVRNRSGLKETIYVKILRSNDKYSIVENYSYSELQETGIDATKLTNKKSISVYDQIEI